MKHLALTIVKHLALTIVLLLPGVARAGDEKDLNGTWIAREATNRGRKVEKDFFQGAKLVFKDGKYSATLGEVTEEGTFKVDRSAKPNALDFLPASGRARGQVQLAIFELDGDTLKVCYNPGGTVRPKEFGSTAENKYFQVVYQRSK
jgi:uncharacterized protein (TIGR03067 family)